MIIIKPINDLDEIWNYNTARAISEGLIPYKDISMITTPLLPMVTAIFLKLIANEVIISRILAALLWTGILFTIYKIFTLLDAGILDRSSVIIGDRYQYNYINENEFIIDEEKLIPDHLFKLDFFDAITS